MAKVELNEDQTRDQFGASGTFEDGEFRPYKGAAERQAKAEARAEEEEARRTEFVKSIGGKNIEEIKKEYPDADYQGATTKDQIVQAAVDSAMSSGGG